MKKHLSITQIIASVLLSTAMVSTAIDNPHFYRATNFLTEFYEPRLAMDWLTSADIMVGFGSTRTARNDMGQKVPLLDVYGPSNMQALGVNVPGKDLTTPGDIILTQLALLPTNDGFGQLVYNGKFKIIEANLSFSKNISCGLFVQAHLPIRRLTITDITYTDLSPTDCASGPCQSTPVWQSFLMLLPTILQQYGLSAGPVHHTSIGDLTLLAGWTNNYEDTQEIDYFDTTFRFGVLFPTGKKKNENLAFDIATGYNGHFAVPITLDFAVGWYDWFTLGAHFGAMPFAGKSYNLRMKTDCLQNGFIKLALGRAHVNPGIIWEADAYVLADHVVCGLSLLLAYSFANKNADVITPFDTTVFNANIVNTDQQFAGWKMHTVNVIVDWDFAYYECPWLPHIGAFYNFVVGGKRIFDTNVGGLEAGLNIVFDF